MKNSENSYKQYNQCWKNIKKYIETKNTFTMEDIFDISFNKEICPNKIYKIPIIHNNKIITANNYEDCKNYFEKSRSYSLNQENIEKYDAIIELGSGWGRNIFYYINKFNLTNKKIISGEYTNEGVEAQLFIKNKFFKNHNLEIFSFDFNNSENFFEKIKEKYNNVLVLTFWSIEQVTNINPNFFENLFKIGENISCTHIEPIGWQISTESIIKENKTGFRHYYNKNLYNELQNLEIQNKIKINNIIVNYFNFKNKESCGSLIEWTKLN